MLRHVEASPLYAKEGEWVTCENGHRIAMFSRDVRWGEMFDPLALRDWQQPEPAIGSYPMRCDRCGAEWSTGIQYHFSNGWRV